MDVLAVVWHFWIAPALVILAGIVLVGTLLAYLRKVVYPRYPRD